MAFLPAMEKIDARDGERDEKDQTDEPSHDELDVRPFVFFGLGFQWAELRYRVLEVNLGRPRAPGQRLSRGRERKQELRRTSAVKRNVFGLPPRAKYAK